MRISDGSSDVCSSDLAERIEALGYPKSSFQRTLRFRGPDLESATEAELVGACARANNVLRRFGSGWALFFEAERIEALGYPDARFPDPASWLVDEERRAAFAGRRGQPFASRQPPTAEQRGGWGKGGSKTV